MNKVILIGRTTSDIELNHTSSNVPYTRLTLAVSRRNQGNNEITDFIPLVAWRNTALLFKSSVPKGSLIAVEGNLQSNSYTSSKTNQIVRTYDVHVDTFHFLESKKVSEERFRNNLNGQNEITFNQTNGSSQMQRPIRDDIVSPINSEPRKNVINPESKSVMEEKLHDLDDLQSIDKDLDIFD